MPFLRLNRSIVLVLGVSLGCFVPRAASQSKIEGQEEHIRRIETSVVTYHWGRHCHFQAQRPGMSRIMERLRQPRETYMKTGQKTLAIANYEKSLELNRKNRNGVDMLKKLKDSK
jgi:hypothetical protein